MSTSEKHGRHLCTVCALSLTSDAELAIHEFSKKHCDNLLRLSKNKPAKTKTLKPPPPPPAPKAKPQDGTHVATEPGNFALYGYFNPTEVQDNVPKEFNTEYDPYLQKLAENPFKEAAKPAPDVPMLPTTNVKSFSRSKKRKTRTCQICNVALHTVPEYEAHMKSAQHVWKLKVSGMGVSAHFVRAGTDLHTIDTEARTAEESPAAVAPIPMSPGDLYCDTCGLLLNSAAQYQVHITGKSHTDNVNRKAKLADPSPGPNQLFCYTCKLSLNNILQYNDHKNGKKHKIKCKTLLRSGVTIPPEERPPDMAWSAHSNSQPVVYPELYQKQVLDKQKQAAPARPIGPAAMPPPAPPAPAPAPLPVPAPAPAVHLMTGMYHCLKCTDRFSTVFKLELHLKNHINAPAKKKPAEATTSAPTPPKTTQPKPASAQAVAEAAAAAGAVGYKCTPCQLDFLVQPPFEMHLNSELHALKILELKKSGTSSRDLLAKVMADRKVIRADRYGRHCCGICAVVSQNLEELKQHLQSLVHKYSEKDYTKKRLLEIQQSVAPNEQGEFHCRLCKESWPVITAYSSHLHSVNHRNLFFKDHIKKNYIHRWLNKRPYRPGNGPEERNPGVRTKVGGTATNLSSGVVEKVPNLEPIEPQIDLTKNVAVGISAPKPKIKKPAMLPPRRMPGMVYRRRPGPGLVPQRLMPPRFGPVQDPIRHLQPPIRHLPPMRPNPHLAPRMWPPRAPHFHPYARPHHGLPPEMRPPYQPRMRPPMRPPLYDHYPRWEAHREWQWY